MTKVVVLLSGGLDSSTLLYEMVVGGAECYPLTLTYGQRHRKEIVAARNICESVSTEMLKRFKLVNLDVLQSLLPSALTGRGDVPEGAYDAPTMSQTVVPGRNLIFLAVAAGYAQGLKADVVAYAAHMNDFSIYSDCRPEFIQMARETLRLGYDIRLLTPYEGIDKAGIVKRGIVLNVPYWMTWSCYNGADRPCLRCGTCVERTSAFLHNGLQDPLLREVEWREAVDYCKSVGVK